jgi:DNA-binding transcriptional ArsR family regulator
MAFADEMNIKTGSPNVPLQILYGNSIQLYGIGIQYEFARAEIFRLLFGTNDKALHMRDIERRSGFAIGTIQGELKKLSNLDLVLKEVDGNRTYYRANKNHPLYNDIHNLVLKTIGLVDVLRNALETQKIDKTCLCFWFFCQRRRVSRQ